MIVIRKQLACYSLISFTGPQWFNRVVVSCYCRLTYIFLILLKAHDIDYDIVLGAGQQFSKESDKDVMMGSTSIVQNSSEYCYVTPNDCVNKRPPPPVAADYNIYNVLYQ